MNKYLLNIAQSPNDVRDYIFDSNFKFTPIYDLRPFLLPVREQGKQGSCYAQASSTMKEYQEFIDYGLKEYLSPQFIYNQRDNLYDDDPDNDSGMYGRNVMKILKYVGICLESSYPYGKIETKDQISEHIYHEAQKHKIKSYAFISTLENLKRSLIQNGPCLITFPVYNYGLEMWKRDNESQTSLGGHAMVVVGYNHDSFIIRNSWGISFGDQGYCYYKFKDWGHHWEVWTTIDEKSVIPVPEPVPEPEPEPVPEPVPEPNREEPTLLEKICSKILSRK